MTYTDKIRKQSLNLLQIQNELKKMLDSRDWTSHFCHSSKDKMQSYSDSLQNMKRRVHLSEIGYISTVFSEDLALMLIKSCLEDNISHIAKFLISEETSIELMGMMMDMNVGYIVNRDQTIQEVSTVIISIRKNDKPCHNSSGFMVEYIYPVKLS